MRKNIDVGILYICTGEYNQFWKDFYISCEKYFMPDINKKYFVFTDKENIEFKNKNNIHLIKIENEDFPEVSLKKFLYFYKNKEVFQNTDYLIYLNSNLVLRKKISSKDILPEGREKLVCFAWSTTEKHTNERRKDSRAYMPKENKYYFRGGLMGGTTKDFLKVSKKLSDNIEEDRRNNIIALWHDESHWNRELLFRNDYKIMPIDIILPEEEAAEETRGIFIDKVKLNFKKYSLFFKIRHNIYHHIKDYRMYKIFKRIKSFLLS